jgi:hypothetical protein
MYPKLMRRARIIRLAVVSLAVFCLAYTGVRAINFKSPNLNPAQSTSRDGVVILFQSMPRNSSRANATPEVLSSPSKP